MSLDLELCYAGISVHKPGTSIFAGAALKKEITQEAFAGFLQWLSPDSEGAGEEYLRLRSRLLRLFSLRHCTFAEELVDETINRVILKVSTEEIDNKFAFCYGVAKNVYRESLRKERVHVDIEEVTIATAVPAQPSLSSECLDRCLEKLPYDSRELLLEYFSGNPQTKIGLRRRLSESLKTTQTALRVRVMRRKEELRICIQKCMGEERMLHNVR